ncbi:WecB/TagA/CpsF family glycosyltransferase [Alteromonas stellipolaris]|uniref:WecB/TagA/CpsF family glycosyltransferase n=1 Tax=Alteromonas stellipolaris TaxID=233316 RepID=UPI002119B6EF|nr:WecB/TagA/CpsF family glycosyltransferase [Alteromonas stellipolaris]MCQ8847332.1 WecB/TagA/CpsF family glycosyltransferase [Alteromonas stellipolaris]
MIELAKSINIVDSPISALQEIDQLVNSPSVTNISFLNAHGCIIASKNSDFNSALLNSDYLFRDGIGVKMMLKSLSSPSGYNANGTDLIPLVLKRHKEKKILCIGTSTPFLDKAVRKMRESGINIVHAIDGFRSKEDMVQVIEQYKPDIVLLGMGMPRQELFCDHFKSLNYNSSIMFICGGAILDFYAERFPRAPNLFRKFGLEWFYRLIKEPKRLFKRYVLGIPMFFLLLMSLERK